MVYYGADWFCRIGSTLLALTEDILQHDLFMNLEGERIQILAAIDAVQEESEEHHGMLAPGPRLMQTAPVYVT